MLRRATSGVVVALTLTAGLSAMSGAAQASPGLTTQDLSGALTPADLASALVGSGVTVSNVQFAGVDTAGGTFAGGGTEPGGIVGFEQGVVLSTGAVADVVGPNSSDGTGTDNGQPGDPSLDALLPEGQSSQDAAVLTFDFVPDATSISFHYVFGSEEYNEFVGSGFNDVFGFFVNGTNCATVGGSPVSINTVNGGNPFGTTDPELGVPASHPELYRNNDPNDPGPAAIDTELDGLTIVLTCAAPVVANEPNTMKLAIADVGDGIFDSDVFIQAGSLTTEPPADVPGAPTDVAAFPGNASAVVSWTAPASIGGSSIDAFEVTCTATGNPADTHTAATDGAATSTSVAGLTNGTEYTCTVRAHNAAGFGPASEPSNAVTPSDANAAAVIDSSIGGIVLLSPKESFVGTKGRLVLPPQPGPGTDVVVTASLFGQPGEVDPTCAGNACVGQGIEWALGDPSAFAVLKVVFIESSGIVDGLDVKTVPVYKDGIVLPRCTSKTPPADPGACVARRRLLDGGGWRVVVRALGTDPKGRI